MKQIIFKNIDIRWGMLAPRWYLKIGKLTIMWWGWREKVN